MLFREISEGLCRKKKVFHGTSGLCGSSLKSFGEHSIHTLAPAKGSGFTVFVNFFLLYTQLLRRDFKLRAELPTYF